MKIELKVRRQAGPGAEVRWQSIPFEYEDPSTTVAAALMAYNEAHPEDEIRFEHSCLQKKCGACAMVIGGLPGLACDSKLSKYARKGSVTIEPLRKFPIVCDLIVDRSILYANLATMETWVPAPLRYTEEMGDTVYEASRCLQCGCCLEVCPNFCPGGEFYGSAAFVPTARLIAALPAADSEKLRKLYETHVYAGCGKSLACHDICPAGIDMDHLLSRSNAMAVWKRKA